MAAVRRSVPPVLFAVVLVAALAPDLSAQEDRSPKNLQVLPKDLSRDSVVRIMRQISLNLGVRCSYCHVGGTNPNTLEGIEFDRDDDPDKIKARHMMRMLDSLNRVVLAALPERDTPPVTMTCKTCHRGQPKPLLLSQELRLALDSGGAAAAVARYRSLRESEAMSGTYDFREWELTELADEVARGGRADDAIALMKLNFEFHAESSSIAAGLGRLYEVKEDPESAITWYEKALELDPDNRMAGNRLRRLKAGG